MVKVAVIVCANGRGHQVRCERVFRSLRAKHWQIEVATIEERAVRWRTDPSDYDDGALEQWFERAAAMAALDDADLVVSDNLPAVLQRRPDAVLMGSFLWSDVLRTAHPTSMPVQKFAALEDALLEKHHPTMICVEGFAMPAVRERTRAFAVGVMVDSPPSKRDDFSQDIGILAGATGAADFLLTAAAQHLRAVGHTVWVGDDALRRLATLDVVVCRPGLGTITDCVAAEVPMVTLAESNPELAWNAAQLTRFGVGVAASTPDEVVQAVETSLAELGERRARLRERPRDGVAETVRFLETRLFG